MVEPEDAVPEIDAPVPETGVNEYVVADINLHKYSPTVKVIPSRTTCSLLVPDNVVICILDCGSVCAIVLPESVIITVVEPAAPVVILLVKVTGSVLKGVIS